ncbi:MAG: hypothetical protein JWQ09_321 [Segetibacter sp.]|nr:hypothetical protein [Segetibacter sp.]
MSVTISIGQFDSLKRNEKADIMYVFGQYLLHFETSRYIFSLYQLSTFYVEMVYDLRKNKRLTKIKSHATPDTINRYLRKIDIAELRLVLLMLLSY